MSRAIEHSESSSFRILVGSFLAALVLQSSVLYFLSHGFSLVHVQPHLEPSVIEAQIYEKPVHESHLTEEKKEIHKRKVRPEPILSKALDVGKESPPSKLNLDEQNQTTDAQPQIVSHGPIVLYSPAPKLPSYLRDQNLKTSVLIEFVVDADGTSAPHLLGTSGNEELDRLALTSVGQWKFSPAVDSNKPIPAKVRLRINFEVN